MNINSQKKWVMNAFPVPSALVLSNTSVDISDGVLRFFECTRDHGVIAPKDFGTLSFPRLHTDGVQDKTKTEASTILKNWALPRNIKMINALIHEDEAYVFKANLPTTNPKEIRSAVEALLEENVPVPPNDALFEYTIIATDEKLTETAVAVSVLSRTTVNEYLNIFKNAGIGIASLDTESRTLAASLFQSNDTGVHAILSIAKRHSIICIVENSSVVFSTSINVGEVDLIGAVSKTLRITDEAAETLMKDEKTNNKQAMELFEAMMPVFGTIRDELGKVQVYWKTQGKKERHFSDIADIILVGTSSVTPGFSEYITSISKIPAHVGSVWTNTLSPDISLPRLHKKDSLNYGSLIGALL